MHLCLPGNQPHPLAPTEDTDQQFAPGQGRASGPGSRESAVLPRGLTRENPTQGPPGRRARALLSQTWEQSTKSGSTWRWTAPGGAEYVSLVCVPTHSRPGQPLAFLRGPRPRPRQADPGRVRTNSVRAGHLAARTEEPPSRAARTPLPPGRPGSRGRSTSAGAHCPPAPQDPPLARERADPVDPADCARRSRIRTQQTCETT